MPKLRMRQAVVQALDDAMTEDPSVILLGEDIAVAGGSFKATEGLLDKFGPMRVRDTPISEMGFLGAAVGAAISGLRPVVEMMFIEFIGVALDELVTEAAKLRYLSRGAISVPLVVRASAGAGLGFGAQHSQMLEQWFRATPGLKVAVASGPQNAYGLLRSAIRDPDPVVVLEPRALYGDRDDVETGEAGVVPLGVARRVTEGEDVTIVALGQMVGVAADAAARATWSGEVIDLQTLVPWDRATVTGSVAKTGRIVVVEEAPYSGGWGTEITDHVCGELFGSLSAPPLRVTTPDVPVPYSGPLEARFLPSAEYVTEQVDELLRTGRRPPPWWERG
jgi:acetoin:2,6-dichlorophenolindophenol oxidoreductase subunit beta